MIEPGYFKTAVTSPKALFQGLQASWQGPHLGVTGEPRGVSRVVAGFSSFGGEYSLPHVLAQGSPIFHSSFKGELGIALESLQGKIDLI